MSGVQKAIIEKICIGIMQALWLQDKNYAV
jgi:hypothetical protein